MARFWLDAARYGDTHGLHLDNYREIWPYRDWVIRAFNSNKPFDQFIVEQLAGDLLPNADPRPDRRHRLQPLPRLDQRGGLDRGRSLRPQHRRPGRYQRHRLPGPDHRLRRCHDHKYDPIRAKDYYQLFAFFNNIDGPALDGNSATWAPVDRRADARRRQAALEDGRRRRSPRSGRPSPPSAPGARPRTTPRTTPTRSESVPRGDLRLDRRRPAAWCQADQRGQIGPWEFVGTARTTRSQRPERSLRRPPRAQTSASSTDAGRKLKVGEGDALFAYVYLDPSKPPREIMLQWHTDGGWSHRAYWGENAIACGKDGTPERLRDRRPARRPASGSGWRCRSSQLGLAPGTVIDGWAFTQHGGTVYWDKAGISPRPPRRTARSSTRFTAWVRAQRAADGAGAARDAQGDRRQARPLEADRGPDESAARLLRRARLRQDPRRRSTRCTPSLAEAEKERKEIEEADPHDPGLPRAGRRAQAGVHAQPGRVRPAGREGGPGRARVPAAAAAGRAGQPAGPGPLAGRARTIR